MKQIKIPSYSSIMLKLWEWKPITFSVLLTLLFIALLQLWRPYFFLTDDNMSEFLPFFINTGRNLWHLKSPFIAHYIFGGDYPVAKDPGFVQQLNPLYWPITLLANTSWKYAIMDGIVALNLLICAAGMAGVCLLIRKRASVKISDAQVVLLAVSYSTLPFAFLVGSSWMQHVAYMAAFPILTLGMLCESFVVGVLWLCIGCIHGFLGGNVGPFIYILTFFSAFVVFKCIADHSYHPMKRWLVGLALAALITLPIWTQTVSGFIQSGRFYPMESNKMWAGRFPDVIFIVSMLLGPMLGPVSSKDFYIFNLPPIHAWSTVFFPLSWLVLVMIAPRWMLIVPCVLCFSLSLVLWLAQAPFNWIWLFVFLSLAFASLSLVRGIPRKEKFSWQEGYFLLGATFVTLFVMRPLWLNDALHQLPAFASTRMPFREIGGVYFFLICWLAFQKIDFKNWQHRFALVIGGFLYFLIFFKQSPPAINEMTMDRRILISGAADHYWQEVKKKLPSNVIILPVMNFWSLHPLSLIGAGNYPLIFEVTGANGKSSARFLQESEKGLPGSWRGWGIYELGAALDYQKQRPSAVILQLTSLNPIEIWLIDSKHREKLDLPALLPPDIYHQL